MKKVLIILLLVTLIDLIDSVRVRRNILHLTPLEQNEWVQAVLKLKHEINPKTNISTYDSYVISHSVNSPYAHIGPAFLPWHRKFLLDFEADLQRVSGLANFSLPYWDWSDNITRMDIWNPHLLGGNGSAVTGTITDGPFTNWGPTYEMNGQVSYAGIRRAWGTPLGDMPSMHHDMGNSTDSPVLPPLEDLIEALSLPLYDAPPYNDSSHDPPSFRNTFEGWEKEGCKLHNTVHLWVGGHMRLVAISVNDPVFWLHHAFVDKVYDLWQRWHHYDDPFRGYLPVKGARLGHNLNDSMIPWSITPLDVLDMPRLGYVYEEDLLDSRIDRFVSDLKQTKQIRRHHTQ